MKPIYLAASVILSVIVLAFLVNVLLVGSLLFGGKTSIEVTSHMLPGARATYYPPEYSEGVDFQIAALAGESFQISIIDSDKFSAWLIGSENGLNKLKDMAHDLDTIRLQNNRLNECSLIPALERVFKKIYLGEQVVTSDSCADSNNF